MATLNLIVAASFDDAFEDTGGSVNRTNSTATLNASGQYFGARMTHASIGDLEGATINSAILKVNVPSASFDDPNVDAHMQTSGSPGEFQTVTNEVSGRSRTTAKTTWNASGVGTGDKTVDITSAVQEIADLGVTISAIAVILVIQGGSLRTRTYDGSTTECFRLDIDYTAGGGGETHEGAAALSGAGTLASIGQKIAQALSALTGTGVLAAIGQKIGQANTALSGAGTIAASGQKIAQGTASLSGSGMLIAVGSLGEEDELLAVSTGNDDGAEATGGAVTLSTNSLDCDSVGDIIGFIVRDFPVPAEGEVIESYINIYPNDAGRQSPNVTIRAEVDPANLVATSNDFSSRTLTTEGASWVASNIGTGAYKSSPSIVDVIQEVVDDPDYQQGDAVGLFLSQNSASNWLRIASYNSSPSQAPQLYVRWSAGGTTHEATITLSGAGALAASGQKIAQGAGSLAGAGVLAATAQKVGQGAIALSGAGSLSAMGQKVAQAASGLSGVGSLTSAGQRIVQAATALQGIGSLAAAGSLSGILEGIASLTGAGSLSAIGQKIAQGATSLSGAGSLAAIGQRIVQAATSLSGAGTLNGVGQKIAQGVTSLAGAGTLAAIGQKIAQAQIALSGVGSLVATGTSGVLAVGKELTLKTRDNLLTLMERGNEITLQARDNLLSLATREP
jgi:hypothetical protein